LRCLFLLQRPEVAPNFCRCFAADESLDDLPVDCLDEDGGGRHIPLNPRSNGSIGVCTIGPLFGAVDDREKISTTEYESHLELPDKEVLAGKALDHREKVFCVCHVSDALIGDVLRFLSQMT
jgi:hypothetical protein